jgi:hypothetical protein
MKRERRGIHAAAWMSGFSSVGHAVPPAPETPKAPRPIVVEQMERNQPDMTRQRLVPERLLKALHLADTLDAAGLGSAEATAMDANEWQLLAMAAGSRKPSPPTRALVMRFLERREAARRMFATTPKALN